MTELLALEHVALQPNGPALSLVVSRGQSLAVVGPAASGKSNFMRVLSGEERPAHGNVRVSGRPVLAGGDLNRRGKVQNLPRRPGAHNPAALATELLLATGLWDQRHLAVGALTPSQAAAAELLEPFAQQPDLLLLDGQLDRLDPWALQGVLQHLRKLRAAGGAVVVATNRPDIIGAFDALIVLRNRQIRFAGSPADLLRAGPLHTVTVATEDQAGVRALVAPFEVSVTETCDGLRFEAREGQALAARLLLEGYGDVRFVVVRPPTIEEALLRVGAE